MEEGKGNSPVGGDTSSRHSYVRDLLGRVTVDSVTAFGADIDDSVDALAYDFDSLGRFSRGRSYKGYVIGSTPPATPLDDVVFSYTGLWEVSQVLQSSRGDTSGAYARTVAYAYETQPVSGGNYSRLQTLTYPDGATQGFKYGASSSTPDSRISRATQLDLGSTALVGYGYVGMGTVAVTDYKVPGIQLDRYRAPSGASTVGNYSGLDKFGRVLRQMWVDTGFTTGSGGNPDRPPVVSTLYAYTKSSDRTQAVDDRPGAAQPLSQGYEYDDLHRLVEARRGVWNGTSVPTDKGSQRWRDDVNNVTLDALGNWRQSWIDRDGDGSYADATERDDRTHDIFNRILGHVLKGQGSGGSDLNLGDLTYDRASNLASWKLQSGTSATAVTAKHDAWNRLTEVSFSGTLRCRQAHNALHWRSFQLSDRTGTGSGAGAGPDGTMDQARLMSYGADWRLLEERVDDNLSLSAWTEGTWSPGTDLDRVQQYVWGTRYVDDIVLHRVDANIDGDYSDTADNAWHHLTDAQFSSVCLIDKAFAVAERVSYSAYGVARHLPMADLNCDGAVNSADIGLLLGASGTIGIAPYQSPADLNRDGVVNSADLAMLLGDFQAAQPDGALSRPNVDNPIGWDGYVFDRESGLYTVRFRTYETGLGRWLERDPLGTNPGFTPEGYSIETDPRAGYRDGMSLYQFVRGIPASLLDPRGTHSGDGFESDQARQRRIEGVLGPNDLDCSNQCCEVRMYATEAFGLSGVYHLCLEIETPTGDGGKCIVNRAELRTAFETDPISGLKREPIGAGPAGGVFGIFRSSGSATGDGSRDASNRASGGTPEEAWGIYVDRELLCGRQRARDASKIVPMEGSQLTQCELAECLVQKSKEIGRRSNRIVEYDPLSRNSNSFVGEVIRACGGNADRPIETQRAPAFNNPFSN